MGRAQQFGGVVKSAGILPNLSRVSAVALVALGLLVLSGCGDDPEGPTGATESHCREFAEGQERLHEMYGVRVGVTFEECYYGVSSPEGKASRQ